MLYPRTAGLMTFYFCCIDCLRRKTNLFKTKWGQFLASGGSAMVAFWIIWPFETLKNQAQAETKDAGQTTLERARYIMKIHGRWGLFRGIIPGS